MRIWLYLPLFLLVSLAPLRAAAGFIDGEELSYVAKWTGVPAGELDMKTKMVGRELWQFEVHAKTNSFWSMVHKVRDKITSSVAEKPFRSLAYSKDESQGRRHILEEVTADYEKDLIRRSRQNLSAGEKASVDEFKLDPEMNAVQDPLSMIYLLRTFEFKNIQELDKTFSVFASKETYSLKFNLKGDLVFESAIFGPRRVWHLEPSAEYAGNLVTKGKLELWVDCETGIPLRLVFNIPVGWASLELKSTNNPKLQSTSFRERRGH